MTAVVATMLLATSGVWNPLPGIADWWARVNSLSQPAPPWSVRLGESPEFAALTISGELVVVRRDQVEARSPGTGDKLWQRDASWALVAGDVVVSALKGRGYAVVDPASGAVLWSATTAVGVWAYHDIIIDLVCPDACTLRAREHRGDGRVRWTAALPAQARRLSGPNPQPRGVRDPASGFDRAAEGSPGDAPTVLALPVDQSVIVVDVVAGRVLRRVREGDGMRAAASGPRLVVARADRSATSCQLSVEAYAGTDGDPARPGTGVWHRDGYDLGTASGGCEQRRDPAGGGGALLATRPDRRPVLLHASDGAPMWVGEVGERVLATDGVLAAVQRGEGAPVRILDLSRGGEEVFVRAAGASPEVAVTAYSILIRDRDEHRLLVLSRAGTLAVELTTKAEVIGYGPSGIVLNNGRTIGVISVRLPRPE